MPRKTSFYLDDEIEAILAVREGAPPKTRRHGRRSQLITLLLRRYEEVCHEDLPQLTPEEWKGILEASRSWSALSDDKATSSMLITTLVEATKRLPNGHQTTELVKKVVGMTPGQRLAIVDFVERQQASKDRGEPVPALPGAPDTAHKRVQNAGSKASRTG